MRKLVLLCVLLISVTANASDLEYLQSLRNTSYEVVEAPGIGRSFHVYTMLPDSYTEDTDRHYPSIYILDGGTLFPLLGSYHRSLRAADETQEAIIVGISYGADSFADGNYRSTDFTAPSEERDYWGGAEKFRDFLESVLIPRIESQFRADADKRILFGHSLGGQFVLFSAQTRPTLFWGHIASNPALHRNLDYFLETVPRERSSSRLYVGTATLDEPRFRVPLSEWIATWTERTPKPWQLHIDELPGFTHSTSQPVAFRQGLAWLYAVESSR